MEESKQEPITRRHVVFGWWALLIFLTMGLVLEALHGFKVGWYLDVGNETRRLMFRLAHAHGALLALLNIVFGLCVRTWSAAPSKASPCFLAASIAIPGGFFLGGLVFFSGDPGYGILLLPIGAICLFAGVLFTALHASRQ